jgi:hypothetical protein
MLRVAHRVLRFQSQPLSPWNSYLRERICSDVFDKLVAPVTRNQPDTLTW